VKSKIAGILLAVTFAGGSLGLAACSSDDSNSGSVSDQAQQAQDQIDNATQQGKEAVDQANKAVDDAKNAVDSVQGSD
jgi:hypothetical protein